ncbi:MAG: DedA family protein [Deltaproteobacteria bacterium]|nr:DedA family protein [Deltaproteobacteria bacterium]
MAMESTVFPLPSELVVPPAAFLLGYKAGSVDYLQLILVIVAGTVGSYLGSALMYWLSRWVGRPIIVRYGKYFLIPEKKLKMAEEWVGRYGAGGIFFARLLPVVRHLISIPAGIANMPFKGFSLMTIAGSCLWCTVLTIFGVVMANDMRVVMESTTHVYSDELKHAFHNLTYAIIAMVLVLGVLYIVVVKRRAPAKSEAK